MNLAGFQLPHIPPSTQDLLLWGGLIMVGAFTWATAGQGLKDFGEGIIEGSADDPVPAKAMFGGWTEGMPYRDRSIWYQWRADFGSNNPTKRLTVA